MSGQMKIKSLSLSRRTQTSPRKEEIKRSTITEEDKAHVSNLEAVLNSPISRPSRLCSTPIQKNVDYAEESPDQYYRDSPTSLYPCTQESGNEIAWDWQSGVNTISNDSPSADRATKNGAMLNQTPKRPQLLNKKRMAKSNSPLLIQPKRKLVALDVAESIGKFAAEMKALADKITIELSDGGKEAESGTQSANNIGASTSKQLGILDMETQKVFDIHEATTLKVSYSAEEKNGIEKVDSSLDDLFDDSVDACMVQCSQEVESKLMIESEATRSAEVSRNSSGEGENRRKDDSADRSCAVNLEDIKGFRRLSDASCSDMKRKEQTIRRPVPSCENPAALNDIPASQIPDDSFDDCLALCLDDDDDLMSKFVAGKNNDGNSKKICNGSDAAVGKLPAKELATNYSVKINSGPSSSRNTESTNNMTGLKRKQFTASDNSSRSVNQNRKFFKEKSLSDSYCGNSTIGKAGDMSFRACHQAPISKSSSSYNLGAKTQGKANEVPGKVCSTPNLKNSISTAGSGKNCSSYVTTGKQTFSENVSYSYLKLGKNDVANTAANSHDHYSAKIGQGETSLKDLRTTVLSNSQQLTCTPEEIERKRREARMRLEANKLKKQMSSNKSNVPISLPVKRPSAVKR